MGFRIAIGPCSCRQPSSDSLGRTACGLIDATLSAWRPRLPADLAAVPVESYEVHEIDGCPAVLGVHKHQLADGGTLVIVHVFIHTWSRPTFLSFGQVGRLYAEGILVAAGGEVSTPPDELMWEFR